MIIDNLPEEILASIDVTRGSEAISQGYQFMLKRKAGENLDYITRFEYLNKNLGGGLPLGTNVIIGARPSIGKSALLNLLALDIFRCNPSRKVIVLYFNLEMPSYQQGLRYLSNYTGKSYLDLVSKEVTLTAEENSFLVSLQEEFSKYNLFFVDTPKTPNQMYDMIYKVKDLYKEYDIFVLVDHSRLVLKNSSYVKTEEEKLTDLYATLARANKELNSSSIVLSQLNREQERDSFKLKYRYPSTSDLFGADSAGQFGNIIMLLDRPEKFKVKDVDVYSPTGTIKVSSKNLIVGVLDKNRNGPVGKLYFEYNKASFDIVTHSVYADIERELKLLPKH